MVRRLRAVADMLTSLIEQTNTMGLELNGKGQIYYTSTKNF